MSAPSQVLLGVAFALLSWSLVSCQAPRASSPVTGASATEPPAARAVEASTHVHAAACALPPFALSVSELQGDALGVALLAPDGSPVLAGEWSRREARFHAHSLTLLGRFAVELATAPERTFDFTLELPPEAALELAALGGSAHRASLLGGFEGEARTAADQLALAAASLGSLLSRAPVVRTITGEDGGTCGAAPGFFPHACAEHGYCYALSVEVAGADRAACDAQFLEDLRDEATFQSEPFVDLVHAAARAYGWRAWPLTAAR
jgi:hypothetical protein